MVRMKPPTFSGLATRKPWSSGASPVAYAAALTQSSQAFPRAALPDDPADRGRASCRMASTAPPRGWARAGRGRISAMASAPRASSARGHCPLASPVRQAFGAPFHPLWYPGAPAPGWAGGCPGATAPRAGVAHGARVRRGCQDQPAGWAAVLADPQLSVPSPR